MLTSDPRLMGPWVEVAEDMLARGRRLKIRSSSVNLEPDSLLFNIRTFDFAIVGVGTSKKYTKIERGVLGTRPQDWQKGDILHVL